MDTKNISALRIGLASPERIVEWSHGEVKNTETINYRTQKPEPDGLFCQRIFGPSKDWECECGKYKKVSYKGVVCDRCGVEVTRSRVRRERMGHITLQAPVVHTWYLKSVISLLLNVPPKQLEEVAYFVSWIVVDPMQTPLLEKQILSESEFRENVAIYGSGSFVALTGAEAIQSLLKRIDFQKEMDAIDADFEKATKDRRVKLIKRLEMIKAFMNSGNKPEWMVLTVLPVIPPDLRPMLQLDGGRFATSDANDLYRRVIQRNNRLGTLISQGTPAIIVQNEKRMLQEAVDSLIDNKGKTKSTSGGKSRPSKSLSDSLKGKQGRFRQNLLGKRVDYSGRSVIAVGPSLKMYECGLPKEMAIQLFKPFIVNELVLQSSNLTSKAAEKMIDRQDSEVWDVVDQVISKHPVFLNRAPTLHRLGIQAFFPRLVEGRAIRLHPLVCTAFNADFDGDQMAVHLPLSETARAEAEVLMLGSNNILGPKDGKPIVTPSQDMVLGNFYLNMEETAEEYLGYAEELEKAGNLRKADEYRMYASNEGHLFSNFEEALAARSQKLIHLHSRIAVPANCLNKEGFTEEQLNSYLITTVGKLIFNDIFPSDFPYINAVTAEGLKATPDEFFVPKGVNIAEVLKNRPINPEFKQKDLSKVIAEVFKRYQNNETSDILDSIKDLGFEYSTVAGVTVSLSDINVAPNKAKYVDAAKEQSQVLSNLLERGLLTPPEWEKHFSKLWDDTKNEIAEEVMASFPRKSPINMMAVSGARGNKSHFTQLAGMRGLMARPTQSKSKKEYQPSIIEVPIYSSFREGLNVSEFFLSTHGVRKGLTDTALKTAESGYLTRRLVDVAQDVVIKEEDCGTDRGYVVKEIVDRKDNTVIETLFDRIVGRYCKEDVIDPETKEVICEADTYIEDELAQKINDSNVSEVIIRNAFTCDSLNGLCRKCYGRNMATGRLVESGESVGVMAAQSIGEPGTQLTMRTFHTGGVAAGNDGDITQGLPRVEELFEVREPKKAALLSKISGEITEIKEEQGVNIIVVTNQAEAIEHKCAPNQTIRSWFKVGSKVEAGDKLTEGIVYPKELLQIAGNVAVQDYIVKEVKKVYAAQGIDISDKHVEIIIRQMMKKVVILKGNDTGLQLGQTLSLTNMRKVNQKTLLEGKVPAIFGPTILGISKSSIETDSFLSAASFQETTKVLTNAAVNGKVDYLLGLKENVILGKRIPAGTGTKYDRATTDRIRARAEELREERINKNIDEEELPSIITEITPKSEKPKELDFDDFIEAFADIN